MSEKIKRRRFERLGLPSYSGPIIFTSCPGANSEASLQASQGAGSIFAFCPGANGLALCDSKSLSIFSCPGANSLAQLEELVARGGIDNKQEKRERTIRVRLWTYNELRKIGVMGMDFDDVITQLIEEHNKKKRHAD